MELVTTGGDYSASWGDAFAKTWAHAIPWVGSAGIQYLLYDQARYNKDRAIQNAEFNALKNATKTVNYGSAITNPSDVSGEVTTEEQQAQAALATQEEEELLGKRMQSMGSTSLFRGLR